MSFWSSRLALTLSLGMAIVTPCHSENPTNVKIEIVIRDLPADMKKLEPDIRENIIAAANLWLRFVEAKPCSIEIDFSIKPWSARGYGRSAVAVPMGDQKVKGKSLVEEGLAHELRTGTDPNGTNPDVEIAFDPEYVKTLWWDPKPNSRTRPIPPGKLDAVSVIAHEFGHAIGFNGRIDPKTGAIPGGEVSPYDQNVTFDGTNFFFNGATAVKAYRKPIPLSKTQNNYHHFGEPGPKLDRKLNDDLMNGLFMQYEKRYKISDLDLAILSDCGLPIRK